MSTEHEPLSVEAITRVCHAAARALQIEEGAAQVDPAWPSLTSQAQAEWLARVQAALDLEPVSADRTVGLVAAVALELGYGPGEVLDDVEHVVEV